jgi:hypothetical protein
VSACCDDCKTNEAMVRQGTAAPAPCPCASPKPGVAQGVLTRGPSTVGVGGLSPTTSAVLFVVGGAFVGFAGMYAFHAYRG